VHLIASLFSLIIAIMGLLLLVVGKEQEAVEPVPVGLRCR
jgi:hypothetical protein